MAALSKMRPRDRGQIVNVGSALAFIGIPLQSAYCSSKFACRGFFESTRAELIHENSHIRLSMVHLPAVNTPQFDWCQSVFDVHPQPAPPIYQPEIPAKFIVDVALDGRRHKTIGSWNKILVFIAQLAPGFGNQYAAIGAWDSQLTSQKVSPDRPSNLYEPVDLDTDHGAHGEFDHDAHGFFTPSFLKTLPQTAVKAYQAAARTINEKTRRL
jgi:NAD(P)-dependent dehydrogenase (short-subunit alcohol dehydrogenase family)